MSVIIASRNIGPVEIDCLISESHKSSVSIATYPLERGTVIADHAYIQPKTVTLKVMSKKVAEVWADLIRFQESLTPFTLVTGLTVYRNMMITSVTGDRTVQHAYTLPMTVECQEVRIVDSEVSPLSGSRAPSVQNRVSQQTTVGDVAVTVVSLAVGVPI